MAHEHYHKDVAHLKTIDVYRVLELFGVAHPALQHAVKKLLVAGGRGMKDADKDVQEAMDSLLRWRAMRREDASTPNDKPKREEMPAREMCWPTVNHID